MPPSVHGRPGDFDKSPPMPVGEYGQTVRRVNVGYELTFALTHAFLRSLKRPDLRVLAVGAGGGAEVERFLPENPGWHLTGVDPSEDMLAMARAKAESLGVADRLTLVRGTVEELPPGEPSDVATCLYVLHFLPDAAKLALLRGIRAHLRPGAPLIVASGTRVEADEALGHDLLGAWQKYGELQGMPAERMSGIIQQLLAQQAEAARAEDYVTLFQQAGFQHVASLLSVMNGALNTWIAR